MQGQRHQILSFFSWYWEAKNIRIHLAGESTGSDSFFLKNAFISCIPNAPEHEKRGVEVSGIVDHPVVQELYKGASWDRDREMIDISSATKREIVKGHSTNKCWIDSSS